MKIRFTGNYLGHKTGSVIEIDKAAALQFITRGWVEEVATLSDVLKETVADVPAIEQQPVIAPVAVKTEAVKAPVVKRKARATIIKKRNEK